MADICPPKLPLPFADLDPLLSKAQTPLVQFHEKNTGNVRFMTYYSRLKRLNLEGLEIRPLRADGLLVHRILFGLINIDSSVLFTLRNRSHVVISM